MLPPRIIIRILQSAEPCRTSLVAMHSVPLSSAADAPRCPHCAAVFAIETARVGCLQCQAVVCIVVGRRVAAVVPGGTPAYAEEMLRRELRQEAAHAKVILVIASILTSHLDQRRSFHFTGIAISII